MDITQDKLVKDLSNNLHLFKYTKNYYYTQPYLI
jgi:hypothetical protein